MGSDAPSPRSMRLASAPPPEAHLNGQVTILPRGGTELSRFLHQKTPQSPLANLQRERAGPRPQALRELSGRWGCWEKAGFGVRCPH